MNPSVEERRDRVGRAAYSSAWRPDRIVSAPGRIELIGNHLDYNGGPVLAAAIDRRISIAVHYNNTRQISAAFADIASEKPAATMVAVDDRIRDMSPGVQPENYLIGVIQALDANGIERHSGAEMVVAGDLPHGVGISSSAALCVALVAAIAKDLPDPLEHVRLAREAENRTGSPCGAMDQSASVFGDVIRFNGKDLSVQPITADLSGYEFILANSNVVRTLGASSYPVRVQETGEAVTILQGAGWSSISFLADVPLADMEQAAAVLDQLGQPNLGRRMRHVVTETERVASAQIALDDRNWYGFGEIMSAAGRSSALDYEISHPDVEELVLILHDTDGVLGARMMGGGEGGSVLALIRHGTLDSIIDRLQKEFYGIRGGPAAKESVIACRFDRGVSID